MKFVDVADIKNGGCFRPRNSDTPYVKLSRTNTGVTAVCLAGVNAGQFQIFDIPCSVKPLAVRLLEKRR